MQAAVFYQLSHFLDIQLDGNSVPFFWERVLEGDLERVLEWKSFQKMLLNCPPQEPTKYRSKESCIFRLDAGHSTPSLIYIADNNS